MIPTTTYVCRSVLRWTHLWWLCLLLILVSCILFELVVRTTKLLPPKTGLKQRASAVILQRTLLLVVPPWPIVVLQLLHRQLLLQLVRIQLRVLPTAVVVVILFLQPIFPTDWILLANPK